MSTRTSTHEQALPEGRPRVLPPPARNRRARGGGPLAASACALAAAAVIGLAAAPATAQSQREIQDLKRQMETLQRQVEKLEAEKSQPPKDVVRAGKERGSFVLPGTNTEIRFGGFLQGDVQVDFAGDPGDTFSAANITLQDESSTNRSNKSFRAVARNTRFQVGTTTPTSRGDVKGFLQIDFRGPRQSEVISNAHTPRFREGYAEFPVSENGRLLVGQTWSNFHAVGFGPVTTSFVGSAGGIFARQAQVRYTHDMGGGTAFRLSVENPETRVGNAPAGTGPNDVSLNDFYPDTPSASRLLRRRGDR